MALQFSLFLMIIYLFFNAPLPAKIVHLLSLGDVEESLHDHIEPRIQIVTGGYEFYASYKLGMRSSSSYLLVNAITGRGTGMVKCTQSGKVLPASFFTTIRSKIEKQLDQ